MDDNCHRQRATTYLQAKYALAQEDHEFVVEYWGSLEVNELADLDTGSELVEELERDGAVSVFLG